MHKSYKGVYREAADAGRHTASLVRKSTSWGILIARFDFAPRTHLDKNMSRRLVNNVVDTAINCLI